MSPPTQDNPMDEAEAEEFDMDFDAADLEMDFRLDFGDAEPVFDAEGDDIDPALLEPSDIADLIRGEQLLMDFEAQHPPALAVEANENFITPPALTWSEPRHCSLQSV